MARVAGMTARADVERVAPNSTPNEFRPGDFVLTHGNAWTSRCIRIGQAIRFVGASRKYTWWNHTALIVDAGGDIVEALGSGVQRRNLGVYRPTEYHLVRIDASPEDRREMVAFAETCVGLEYGYFVIASIAFSLLTGSKFSFGFEGQYICSGLVARALERTSYIIPSREKAPQFVARTPSHTMPAHLAEFFAVEPPARGTPIGRIPGVREGCQER